MVFTVDVSGSQQGAPLEQEKAAMRYALTHMGPEDTFQVIRFGNTAERLFPQPMPADRPSMCSRPCSGSNGFEAGGGHDADRRPAGLAPVPRTTRAGCASSRSSPTASSATKQRPSARLHRDLGPSRIFSFGVGSSTNRYLLDHMAKLGNGAVAYLPSRPTTGMRSWPSGRMAQFFDRISHPALTDLAVDWGGVKVNEVFPQRVPDLFVGRPVMLTGKFSGGGSSGRAGARAGSATRNADIRDPREPRRRRRQPPRHVDGVGPAEDRRPGRRRRRRAERSTFPSRSSNWRWTTA